MNLQNLRSYILVLWDLWKFLLILCQLLVTFFFLLNDQYWIYYYQRVDVKTLRHGSSSDITAEMNDNTPKSVIFRGIKVV